MNTEENGSSLEALNSKTMEEIFEINNDIHLDPNYNFKSASNDFYEHQDPLEGLVLSRSRSLNKDSLNNSSSTSRKEICENKKAFDSKNQDSVEALK